MNDFITDNPFISLWLFFGCLSGLLYLSKHPISIYLLFDLPISILFGPTDLLHKLTVYASVVVFAGYAYEEDNEDIKVNYLRKIVLISKINWIFCLIASFFHISLIVSILTKESPFL